MVASRAAPNWKASLVEAALPARIAIFLSFLAAACGGSTENARDEAFDVQTPPNSYDTPSHPGTSTSEQLGEPANSSGAPTTHPQSHPRSQRVQRGEQLFAAGDPVSARRAFEDAIRENPRDPVARLDLGLILEQSGDLQGAERAYQAAASIDATYADALNALGLLQRDQGRIDDALTTLRHATSTNPRDPATTANLALVLEDAHREGEAAGVYAHALAVGSRDPMVFANYGQLLLKLHRVNDAADVLERGLTLAGDDVPALQTLGNGLRRAGHFESALRAMRAAVQYAEEPTPALLCEFALAQIAAQQAPAAEQTLTRALELDPNFAVAHFLLARVLSERGQTQQAEQHMRRYRELGGQ